MAQLTPSIEPAARPFAPALGSRAPDNPASAPAAAFTGQLDQALAGAAADAQQAGTPPPAGSAPNAPDPASLSAKAIPAPQPLALPATAANASPITPPPAAPLAVLGKSAAPRINGPTKPESGHAEAAAPGSSLTPVLQPSDQPAIPQAATLPAATSNPTLANPSPPGDATTAGTPVLIDPHEPAAAAASAPDGAAAVSERASTALPSQPRSARDASGKQSGPAARTLATDEAEFDPADAPAQPGPARSPGALASPDLDPKLSTAQPLASKTSPAGAASSAATASEIRGRAAASGQPHETDDPSATAKPATAGTPGPDTAPPPTPAESTSATPALAAHPTPPPVPPAASPGPALSAQLSAASTPPSPAAQLAEAVAGPVQIALTDPQSAGGAQTLTIHLKPDDLGRVDIRIERPADGPARIELAVERPETLLRLVHDQSQLQQALDQAGISPLGRTIQFSLAPDTSFASGSGANAWGAGSPGDGASGGSGQRFQHGYAGHASRSQDEADLSIPATAWARAGLDITA